MQPRQPPGDWPDHGDAPAGQIEPGAGDDHPDHHHERDGKPRSEPFSDEDGRNHENRQAEGQRAESRQAFAHLPQLPERPVRLHVDAEHPSEHGDADLDADAGEKADEGGARQEVGEEAQLEDPREQQEAGGQEGQHADQRHVFRARDRRHARKRARKDRRGGRVGRHDQMARRAEQGEADERQEHGVEAGDDRRAGDARVAQHLGDVHRCEGDAGQRILQGLARLQRHEALKNGDMQRHDVPFQGAVGASNHD